MFHRETFRYQITSNPFYVAVLKTSSMLITRIYLVLQEIVPIRDEKAEVRLATVLRFACQRLPPEHILEFALPGITAVQLRHAVRGLPLSKLLTRLTSLQELDLSGNQMGPQAFRVVCLSMRRNSTLKSLNLANNGGDTDSSVSFCTTALFKICKDWLVMR